MDTFRYFLARESPVGGDVNFSETAIALRHNSELADTYGNLVNRALSLCSKYCVSVASVLTLGRTATQKTA